MVLLLKEREKEDMGERNNVLICGTCGRNGLLSIIISYGIFFMMTHKITFIVSKFMLFLSNWFVFLFCA